MPPFSPSHSPQMVQRRDSYTEKGFWRPVSISTGTWGSSARPEKTQLRTSGWDGDAWALGIAAIPVPTSQSGKRHHSCSRRKRCRRVLPRREGKVVCSVLSHVRLFRTPWTVARQAPPFVEFSRQEYWSGLPFLSPGESSWPRDQTLVSCVAPALADGFFTSITAGKPRAKLSLD